MIAIPFLAEWALRSSILIAGGALLLRVLRVKDPGICLAAWTAMLCGSLATPALTAALPKGPLAVTRWVSGRAEAPVAARQAAPVNAAPQWPTEAQPRPAVPSSLDWARAAVTVYVLVAVALLLRLSAGLAMTLRLVRGSRATGRTVQGIEIRESARVAVPVTLGIARPAIVLPVDWRQWDTAKLEAVLAHERSHIRRHDPAVQLLSAIHRAVLWHSPLSWFLHSRIVRAAEQASDDAAVAATRDRALYAAVLLEFVGRAPVERAGMRSASWSGVPMARYGRPEARIDRILDETALSRGVTRWSVAAILLLGAPLAYLAAAAGPQGAAPSARPSAPPVRPQAPPAAPMQTAMDQPPPPAPRPARQTADAAATPQDAPDSLTGIGNVAPFYTVTVKSCVDGELMSVSVKEGEQVQQGQLLATIDPRPYQIQLERVQDQLAQAENALKSARAALDRDRTLVAQHMIPQQELDAQMAAMAQLEGRLKTGQLDLQSAQLQLSYTQIRAPFAGVVGLRLLDPGNIVHASDAF